MTWKPNQHQELKVFAFKPVEYLLEIANRSVPTRTASETLLDAYFNLIDKTLAERHPDLMQRHHLDRRKPQPQQGADYA